MNDAWIEGVARPLLILLAAAAVYALLLFGTDALLAAWKRRQGVRREIARIRRESAEAVNRIGAAFLVAQQLLRNEADRGGTGPVITDLLDHDRPLSRGGES